MRLLSLTFLIFAPILVFSQGQFTQFNTENTGSNSLQSSVIRSILVDNSNKTWVITNQGISIIEGSTINNIPNNSTTPINLVGAYDATLDSQGNIWISGEGAIYMYDGTTWTTYDPANSSIEYIGYNRIHIDNQNRLWLLANCIVRYNPTIDEYIKYNKSSGHLLSDNTIAQAFEIDNTRDLVWFETQRDVGGSDIQRFNFNGENIQTFDASDGIHNNDGTGVLYCDNSANIWFGGCCGYLTKYNGSSFTQISYDGGDLGHVTSIGEDSNGNIWLGGWGDYSQGGYSTNVAKFDGTTFTFYNHPLTPQQILNVEGDNIGNIWLGTNNGLSQFDGTSWTSISTKDGVPGNSLRFVYNDKSNKIWTGTEYFIGSYFEGEWQNYGENEIPYALGVFIRSTLEDKNGHFWFCGEGLGGLLKYNGTSWTLLNDPLNNNISNGYCLYEDNQQNIWTGGDHGVTKYDFSTSSWTWYDSNNSGLPNNWVYEILQDNAGYYWFATEGGLSKFDGSTSFTTYNTTNTTSLPTNSFQCGLKQSNGNLWFGTIGGGIVKFDGSTWTTYNGSNVSGFLHNNIYDVFEDSKGNLWFGTYEGAMKFDGTAWKALKPGISGKDVHSITERNDTIWMATGNGLWAYYEPDPFSSTTGTTLLNFDFASNEIEWADFDNDGDLDVLAITRETPFRVVIYRNNNGTSFTESQELHTESQIFSIATDDFNNNGKLDIVISTETATKIFENSDIGFTEKSGAISTTFFDAGIKTGDIDNDGDVDIVISGGEIKAYINNGNFSFTESTIASDGGSKNFKLADFDNDNDLDIVTSGSSSSKILLNNGSISFSAHNESLGLGSLIGGGLDFGDYNNDGNLDITISGTNDDNNEAAKILYGNGSGNFTDISASIQALELGDTEWLDYDNDGDLDLALTGEYNSGNIAIATLYENNNNTFYQKFSFPDIAENAVEAADFDNDGDLDLIMGGELNNSTMGIRLFRNNALTPNTRPNAPSGLNYLGDTDELSLFWTSNGDAETPKAGLSYNVRVGTTAGGSEIVSAHALADGTLTKAEIGNAQLGTSFVLKNLPEDTYYWSVQAIDHGFMGSEWASEQTFTVQKTVTIPVAPSSLQANASSGQIALNWIDNSDNEDGFEIHRSTTSGTGYSIIHTTIADVTSYTDNQGLSPATEYFYKICSKNTAGESDFTSEVSATTSEVPPANPSDLSATAVSKTQINLSWTDNSNNEDEFRVYRSSTSGEKGTLLADGTLAENVTTFQNTGLNISTTYYYTVCAYNIEGESCSQQASATTLDDTTPDVTSASCCVGTTVPDLTATGENIKWYSDFDLTDHIHSGTSFSTGHTEAATYTYYATQTINALESDPATVTLTIHALPTANAGEDFSACSSGVQLNANTPTTGDGIWSTNGASGNLNDDTSPTATLTGVSAGSITLTWEVTDANNCINSDDVAITIKESPAAPNIHKKGGYIYICTDPDLAGYQWYKDDVALSGETGQYYVAEKNSTSVYALEITGDNGCKTKVTYTQSTKKALSLEETVQLYPNPVSSQLNIEMDNDRLGTILMKVLSQSGEVLYANEINKDTDWLQYQLGLETLKQGYYLLEFHFSSDEKVTKKILKM